MTKILSGKVQQAKMLQLVDFNLVLRKKACLVPFRVAQAQQHRGSLHKEFAKPSLAMALSHNGCRGSRRPHGDKVTERGRGR